MHPCAARYQNASSQCKCCLTECWAQIALTRAGLEGYFSQAKFLSHFVRVSLPNHPLCTMWTRAELPAAVQKMCFTMESWRRQTWQPSVHDPIVLVAEANGKKTHDIYDMAKGSKGKRQKREANSSGYVSGVVRHTTQFHWSRPHASPVVFVSMARRSKAGHFWAFVTYCGMRLWTTCGQNITFCTLYTNQWWLIFFGGTGGTSGFFDARVGLCT